MKKPFLLFILFTLLLGLIGCSSKESVSEDDILKLVKDYKTVQYNIKDPSNPPTEIEIGEKVKNYFSEKEFEKQMANRVFATGPLIAKKTNKSIELEDIVLEEEKKKEDGSIDYNYILKLKFYDENSSETIEKKGQLTIKELTITRDWEERTTKIGNEVF
ncbi:hypothetical protein J2Z40_000508 [Cytobacillus eiseniae]|uniref:Lipoprotein n=1 Tax=Cytobacillus eiseniae TaxID=762947 RepID=A0ABS4RC66_9BACI|nr:hypothetical protein [Cytobacillus eiseniae]MBP2239955.1 hypothetical protein [Cytobacillus eiseniae]